MEPAPSATPARSAAISDPSTFRTSRTSSPSGLRCAGAVDFTTRAAWRSALAELTAAKRDAHLDLSELTFIDVHGTSILVEAASRTPQAPRIVLHQPPPMMLRILAVFWPSLPTIEVVHT
ncbi:STAS domain-containing protein [Nocardia arthritidis]|uniref:STAS domain-containing protein n=1 Tax=Nocardia arthritidis TaxID=228602 RepID=UPI0009FC5CFB|nr:STAS domain-containing protein [Nocardia arthritidis]